MPTFWALFPALHDNTLAMVLLDVTTLAVGPITGSTVAGALLGNPGENVTKVGTILPLPYQRLSTLSTGDGSFFNIT